MSRPVRVVVFLVAGAWVGLFLLWGVNGLPAFGHYRGPYGLILNAITVPLLHPTNVVMAVTFDYRGFDTLIEETILFVAVGGIALLLRTERDEFDTPPPEAEQVDRQLHVSDAVHAYCYLLVAPVVVLGLYIVTHGHLTPGGGFPGGVILASALALIYLAGEYSTLHEVFPHEHLDAADAIGNAGYVVIGLAGIVVGVYFLQNIVPLGPIGELYSSGTIAILNLPVSLEVGGGLLLILSEFLRQTLQVRANAQSSSGEQQARESGEQSQRSDQPEQPKEQESS